MPANLMPIFVKLAERRCLVAGAGSVAAAKIATLLDSGANVTVVAPRAEADLRRLASTGKLRWIPRVFQPCDLDGIFLVIAATSSPDVNRAVFLEAQRRGILCNSVDDPPHCDFYFPAVAKRGPLQIAISTAGESPAFAQNLRREIETALDPNLGDWLREIGARRRDILTKMLPSDERKKALHRLAGTCGGAAPVLLNKSRTVDPLEEFHRPAAPDPSGGGKVHFVGAGPGDPELLTRKAHALLRSADLVLHDDLVPEPILALAGPLGITVNVGKRCGKKKITQGEIHRLMIESARQGSRVIRLKSGDPGIFGRLAEEMDALAAASVSFEVVPGVTAGVAAAASLGASLTDRRKASRVLIVSGHRAQETASPMKTDWSGLAAGDVTLIVYMPGKEYARLSREWIEAGLAADTPCVVVSGVSTPQQKHSAMTLAELESAPPLDPPSVLLVGRTLEGIRRGDSDGARIAGLLNGEAELVSLANREGLRPDGD